MSTPTFNPGPEAAFAFRQMFGDSPEISPIGQAGNSHFGYVNPINVNTVNPGWHVTTQIPGLKQGRGISIHDSVDGMNF